MPKKSTAVRQSGRTNQLIPWGLGLVGSIGATDNYKIKVLNNSVILPQMASDGGNPFYFGGSHLLEPLWSIGVEELFYLFWAPVFKYIHRFIFPILLFVLVAKLVLLQLSHLGYFPPAMAYLIRILQFESMAYGGIGAYLLFNYGKQLLHYARLIQIIKLLFGLSILGLIFFSSAIHILLFKSNSNSDFEVFVKSFLFAGFLFSMALTNKKILFLSSKPMVYLGEISYGIYMYHLLILTVLILPIHNLHLNPIRK